VQPSSGLAEEQIATLAAEAEVKKTEDRARREVAELRNRAETLVYTCRRSLEVYGAALATADREDIERDTARLEALLEAHPDPATLGQALAALENSSHQIYEAMLSEAGPE
jgi:molecular chaperone DnaK